jgi:hypothetical protein
VTSSLRDTWELRNAAAATLGKAEHQVRQLLAAATAEEVVRLLEAFSPSRSPGPEWTRTFDPLVERLWTSCDASTLAQVEADFRARGPAWVAIANSLAPEHGEHLRAQLSL